MRKIIIIFMAIIITINLTGCSIGHVRVTDGSNIANAGLVGLGIGTVYHVYTGVKNYSDTGNVFKEGIDHAENSKEYTEKKEKEWKKKATVYEEKLDNCIKSHNITDFDATSGAQWNREDIKEQLKDCHLRIKNGESDFE